MTKALLVKNTPLVKYGELGKRFGLKNVYIKDESKNPHGTIKDRRNLHILEEARRLQVDKLVLITSGNNGYSLAQMMKETQIKVVCIINRDIDYGIKKALKQVAYQVIELNLNHKIMRPEELIAFAREKEDEAIWEVTNGYEENYSTIVDEIFKEIQPDYIVAPIGSGGIYLGMIQAIERKRKKTKIIGIGVQATAHSYADKLSTPWTPYAKALEAYSKKGHVIYRLTEQEVKETYSTFQHIVSCEPSSAVVFAAQEKHVFSSEDTVVFLNSGKSILEI
jgi:cysteine synthase